MYLPRAVSRLVLFSDTSKIGTGSSLWQYQNGKPHLIGYVSKTLPTACSHYSVTELEMTGLLINMGLWENILKHREFDATDDYITVTQILKAKTEPASNRIVRQLAHLSAYSFNLYYLKGKDMILADYLSGHRNECEDPSDLIPVMFCRLRDVKTFCIGTRTSKKTNVEKSTQNSWCSQRHLIPIKSQRNKIWLRVKTPKKAVPRLQ